MNKKEAETELDCIFSNLSQGKDNKKNDCSIMVLLFEAGISIVNLTREEIILLYKDTHIMSTLYPTLQSILMGCCKLDTDPNRTNGWMK